jgi:putative CocE/NonD family hydrolase
MTEQETTIPMNDGVRLDISVCTPEGTQPEGGWPAVILVHGHGDAASKASSLPRGRRLAERGYITVSYSVRGQGGSEGLVHHMGAREIFDLQDVVAWTLGELPVHPDRLGVAGSSQGGWHSYMAAAHCPQVATVVPENVFTHFDEFAVHNGCLTKWFMTRTMRRRILTAGLQDMARQWALSGEWFRIREAVNATSPIHFVDRITCPVFIVHGWHDVGMPPNEALEMFDRLSAPKKLYLGGGGHDGVDSPEVQKLRERLVDRWLDHWLKGEDNGIMDEPAITYARRPEWEHGSASTIPPEGSEAMTLFLQSGGSLATGAPDQPDTHANINNVLIDTEYDLAAAIAEDLEGVPGALKREVVSFDAEPCEQDIEILGTCHFCLHTMPNQTILQVNAELFDVAPDGEATLITRSQWGTRTAEPGKHLNVAFDARTIGYVVPAGHTIRLSISNYDHTYAIPYFEPFVARLYHDNASPSSVTIPYRTR